MVQNITFPSVDLNYGIILLIKKRNISSLILFQKKIKSKLIKIDNETDYF